MQSASDSQQPRRVLIGLKDPAVAARIERALPEKMATFRFTPDELIEAIRDDGDSRHVYFADIEHAETILDAYCAPRCRRVLAARCAACPRPPIIFLCGDSRINRHFPVVARRQIRWFLHPTYIDNPSMLNAMLAAPLKRPVEVGIAGLFQGSERPKRLCVDQFNSRRNVIDAIVEEADAKFRMDYRSTERRLVVEEIVNNAIFHAFKEFGRPRYTPATSELLRGDDRVIVESLVNDSLFVFSVSDGAGALRGETARDQIHRQLTGDGLMDTRGRGMFLAFSLANGLVINRAPDRLTQVIVAFCQHHPPGQKFFAINTLPRDSDAIVKKALEHKRR